MAQIRAHRSRQTVRIVAVSVHPAAQMQQLCSSVFAAAFHILLLNAVCAGLRYFANIG